MPLRPYQIEGVAALVASRSLLLADDMGLGKTVQTIAALRLLLRTEPDLRALLVAPASVLAQWASELRRWAPEIVCVTVRGTAQERAARWRAEATIHLVGYETLRSDADAGERHPCRARTWDVLVLDEASRIKNANSGIHRACRILRADRRWALTGTPLENSVDDLHALMAFLGERPRGEEGLADRLRRVQVRRRKEDVLTELPPKTVIEVPVELHRAQRAAYEKAEGEGIVRLQALGPEISITHVLELIVRLKQICNHDPVSGESAKGDDIADRLRTLGAQGHRALVFSQFTDETFGLGFLARRLAEHAPLVFDGKMSAAKRDATLASFRRDARHRALLLSLRAGGVGLNLQEASYVLHLDRWWNPAIEEQAEARAHRMGQTNPVTVYRYTCLGTIEERIEEALRNKRALFTRHVDGVGSAASLSAEETFALFSLRARA